MSRKEPKSKLVISVCKDLDNQTNQIVHMNASISDIDWIINELNKERDILCNSIKTGKIPEYCRNRYVM